MISLILPTQGNPIALSRTIDSVKNICNEVIIGDVCVFDDDKKAIESLNVKCNTQIIELPFNFIFKNGFSDTLNTLAHYATNTLILYLNVGEIIEKFDGDILSKISSDYNAYYIDNSNEKHRWWRCYNKKELKWDGLIHEEIIGEYRPYHKPLFTFADTEKDTVNPFKAKVMNDIKECVYWRQLMQLVENPELLSSTNHGWMQFAKDTYQSMQERVKLKGSRWQSFIDGDLDSLMNDYKTNPEFEKERFNSHSGIEFQGSPMFLGK